MFHPRRCIWDLIPNNLNCDPCQWVSDRTWAPRTSLAPLFQCGSVCAAAVSVEPCCVWKMTFSWSDQQLWLLPFFCFLFCMVPQGLDGEVGGLTCDKDRAECGKVLKCGLKTGSCIRSGLGPLGEAGCREFETVCTPTLPCRHWPVRSCRTPLPGVEPQSEVPEELPEWGSGSLGQALEWNRRERAGKRALRLGPAGRESP